MENQERKRAKTIFSFFKKKSGEETSNSSLKPLSLVEASTSVDVPMIPTVVEPQGPQPQKKFQGFLLMRMNLNEIPHCVFRYGNILLIIKMKLDVLI